jgi:hypothetical protein
MSKLVRGATQAPIVHAGGSRTPARPRRAAERPAAKAGAGGRSNKPAPLPTYARLLRDRARAVVSLLKSPSPARTSMAGRVEVNKTDPLAMIRGYYSAVGFAQGIVSAHPECTTAVRETLERLVSIPPELRHLVIDAAGIRQHRDVEPAEVLGRNTLTRDNLDTVLVGGGSAQWLAISDSTLEKVVFGRARPLPDDLCKVLTNDLKRREDWTLGILRLYARGRERGISRLRVSSWEKVTSFLSDSTASRRVLERLVEAFGADRSKVELFGRKLTDFDQPRLPRVVEIDQPIGDVSRYARDVGTDEYTWRDEVIDGHADAYRIDDATIARLGSFFIHSLDGAFLQWPERQDRPPEEQLDLFRIAVRASEMGTPAGLDSDNTQGLIGPLRRLPNRQESVDVVRRLCDLERLDEDAIQLFDKPLSEHPPTRGLGTALPQLEPGEPLGDAQIDGGDLYQRAWAMDPLVITLSDECMEEILPANWPSLLIDFKSKVDTRYLIGIFETLLRGYLLGFLDNPERLPGMLKTFIERNMPMSALADRGVNEVLARLVFATSLDADDVIIGSVTRGRDGSPLSAHEPFARAARRLDDRALAERAGIDRRGARLKETVSLTVLEPLIPNAQYLEAGLTRPQRDEAMKTQVDKFFIEPIASKHITEESIPALVRLADLAKLPVEVILVERGGRISTLKSHPLFEKAMIADRLRVEKRLRDTWKALDPRSGADNRARMDAITALLAKGKPAVELEQILPELVRHAAEGRIARVTGNAKQLRPMLGPWQHVGVVSILAALFTELDGPQIESLFSATHTPETAKTWAGYALAVRALKGSALKNALRDLVRDPLDPDFTTLGFRLAIADGASVDRVRQQIEAPVETPPITVACALIERALIEPAGSAKRADVVGIIDQCIAQGILLAPEVRAASRRALPPLDISRQDAWPLSEEVVAPLLSALDGYSGAAKEREQIEIAFNRLAAFADPSEASRMIIERIYAKDLERVAPLGQSSQKDPIDAEQAAIEHLQELGRKEDVLDGYGAGDLDWIETAIVRAPVDRFTEDAVIGIAAGAMAGLFSKSLLAWARSNLPSSVIEGSLSRIPSAEARRILRGQPIRANAGNRPSAPPTHSGGTVPKVARGVTAPSHEHIDLPDTLI